VASGFTKARRAELVDELEPFRAEATKDHPWLEAATETSRRPGGVSRWNAGKDLAWEPLRPELVCEVSYDHLQDDRFRHGTHFQRWRPDREPESCTYDQLDTPVPTELFRVFDALT
jgi:ATP-dependent DNA ligase